MKRTPLYIHFTMDCEPPAKKGSRDGPASWEESARSIESFCSRVVNAGYAATLFLSAPVVEEHTPLLDELAERGVELALHVHPKHLGDSRYTQHLGMYGEEDQRALIEYAVERFREAVGSRPQSFRSGDFSSSDVTYGVLYALGFRQGSLSSPGRDVPKHNARWAGASEVAHYVDPASRLQDGMLPFLEVPVTTDPTQVGRSGFAYDLCLEVGDVQDWHRPIIERQLARMAEAEIAFRTLCVFTHNRFAYYREDDQNSARLEALIDYFESLASEYAIMPATIAGTHDYWLRTHSLK